MLKKKILASNIIYVSLAHKAKILNEYYNHLDKIFEEISKFDVNRIKSFIKGDVAHAEINRLN